MSVKFIGLLALLSFATTIAAQDNNESVDDFEPAVDVSAAASEEPAAQAASEVVLPADVRRTETGSRVMDSLDLDRTEITGNQELPKVLYIVPWQKSDPGDLMGKPVNTLLDEVLAPIDRGEFVRQISYYENLQKD
ncbi:MAG: hypothetical protein WBN23_14635 [Woeseia sp.]